MEPVSRTLSAPKARGVFPQTLHCIVSGSLMRCKKERGITTASTGPTKNPSIKSGERQPQFLFIRSKCTLLALQDCPPSLAYLSSGSPVPRPLPTCSASNGAAVSREREGKKGEGEEREGAASATTPASSRFSPLYR